MSHRPGSTDIPSVEITWYPAGTGLDSTVPTAVIRSPSMRMTELRIVRPPLPSINVPPTSAILRDCAGNAAAKKTISAQRVVRVFMDCSESGVGGEKLYLSATVWLLGR